MSNPYGPPGGPGQQAPGSFGGQPNPAWNQGQQPGQGYSQGGFGQGPAAPGPGYGSGYGGPAGPQGNPPGNVPGFGGPASQGPPPGRQGYGPGFGASGHAPSTAKKPVDLGRLLPLVVGGLGVLAFILGFLPGTSVDSQSGSSDSSSLSIYAVRGYLPILVLLAGLLALSALLPAGKKYSLPVAVVSVAGFLGALTSVFTVTNGVDSVSVGWALWLLLVVALLQAGAGVYAWLVESGTLERSAGRPKTPGAADGSSSPNFAPATGGGGGPASGFGGYAPGAYAPDSGASAADPSSYGASGPGGYAPSNPRGNESYGPSAPSAGSAAAPQYGTGANSPGAGPVGSSPFGPSGSDEAGPAGPATGQHGREDGPAPDVTQQVRF